MKVLAKFTGIREALAAAFDTEKFHDLLQPALDLAVHLVGR